MSNCSLDVVTTGGSVGFREWTGTDFGLCGADSQTKCNTFNGRAVSWQTCCFLFRQEGYGSMEYHQVTAQERYLILHHKSNGYSLRQIGEMLNRSASTISRELRRNVSGDGRYRPDKADSYARARRRRG